jgi:formylglycine-generating enzyme required for sulfatase activity
VPDPVVIDVLPFRSGKHAPDGSGFPLGKLLGFLLLLGIIAAAAYACFFFTSRTFVTVETVPKDARVEVRSPGGSSLPVSLKGRSFWAESRKTYQVLVEHRGYIPASTNFSCCAEVEIPIRIHLEEFPWGLLRLDPPIDPSPAVFENGALVDESFRWEEAGDDLVFPAGEHELEFRLARHFPVLTNVVVPARGETNSVALNFQANWAPVRIATIPPGIVYTNEALPGATTPATLELIEGLHPLTIKEDGYMTLRTQVVVRAGIPLELPVMVLQETNGLIRVSSSPGMANVNLADTFVGQTPITIPAEPNTEHLVLIAKAGFKPARKTVVVSPGKTVRVDVKLDPLEGTIRFQVNPPDAELFVDGTSFGQVPKEMILTAVEHQLRIVREGFKAYEVTLKPRSGFVSSIKTDLVPQVVAERNTASPQMASGGGYEFVPVLSAGFRMGSSRREQGRRSNETLRDIRLNRPVYMGKREVTNAEFRKFKKDHHSGSVGKETLNGSAQPVVNVHWQDAARYCNWLSAQDGLPPAYGERGTNVVAVSPMTTGYRLPSEAEWAYCARSDAAGGLLKYPWGEGFPPKEKHGNYGDQSAVDLVAFPIKGYTDGYPATAPPGSFAANRLGLFDMGGNVAEWCHDVYRIYSFTPGKEVTDPLGPGEGSLWSIRGSSYKSAHIRDLRFAFRNYDKEPNPDVGFRICRYIE